MWVSLSVRKITVVEECSCSLRLVVLVQANYSYSSALFFVLYALLPIISANVASPQISSFLPVPQPITFSQECVLAADKFRYEMRGLPVADLNIRDVSPGRALDWIHQATFSLKSPGGGTPSRLTF